MMSELSIYIHWPYCLSKCPYCDFNSHVADKKIDQEEYLELIEKEIDHHSKYIDNKKISSIFDPKSSSISSIALSPSKPGN